jgi:AAA family ATP:ADP antiporter
MNDTHHIILKPKTYLQKANSLFKAIIPIASKAELKKVTPIFSLLFLISFVYHVLRCLKITLIVKASGSGAEVIPFLKFWLVMPSAIGFTYFYVWLAKHPNRKTLVYNILGLFSGFFIIFMVFLYPNREELYLNSLANWLSLNLTSNFHGIIPILRNWPEAIFYVMAEMWSIIVLSILFWGFCNEITKIEDAKRFYALIALGANCAGIFSSQFIQLISKFFAESWSQSVTVYLSTIILNCFFIVFIFIKLDNSQNTENPLNLEQKTSKHKISFLESIKYIFRYKYITLLAAMVIGYNVVFNLADVLWLGQINQRFPSHHELNNYLAQLDFLVGVFSLVTGLFIFSNLMNKFGWKITALVPPIVWLITSICLYIALFAENIGFGLNNLILILGTLQISLGKALKYCIFDQIKEMTFIPLSIEQQRSSKAIVDGIVSRAAKSGSSIVLQGFLIFGVGEIISVTPTISILIIITIFAWIYATNKMGRLISTGKTVEI